MSRSRSELPSSGSAGSVGAAPDELPAGPDPSGESNRAPGRTAGGDGLSRRGFLQTGTSAAGAAALLGLPTVAPSAAAAAPAAVPPPAVLGPGAVPITLLVNGKETKVSVEPNETLASVLRDRMGLTGTKKGCDRGQCGACTVLLNGRRINSCLALAVSQDGADVLTIEGLAQGDACHPLQAAFIAHDAFQCGFCTPGQIMSALGLIQEGQAGDDPERVREGMSGNLCRCGAYRGITEAVLETQRTMSRAGRKEAA